MTMQKFIKPIVLGLAMVSLSACVSSAKQYSAGETLKRNSVQHIRLSETIDLSHEGANLTSAAKQQINMFLVVNKVGYGDSISLDTGSNNNHNAHKAVKNHLQAIGLKLEARAPITGLEPTKGKAIIIVDRYVVTPPNCNSSATHRMDVPINVQSPSYGCSQQVNLGMMVANPQDLVDPQQTDNTSADIATSAARDYRRKAPAKRPAISSPLSGGAH